MISVESHSKQIKLLNDYIVSLEKQISTAKKEQEELQKGSGVSNDEQRRTNDEITKLRNENGQLKYSAYKLDEQLRRFTALEKELAVIREQLSKERQEKQVLAAENNHLREGNSGYEVRKKTSEEELEKRKTAYEEERQKLQNDLEDQRKTATLKERRC
jgi:chromosome segregation ATPase